MDRQINVSSHPGLNREEDSCLCSYPAALGRVWEHKLRAASLTPVCLGMSIMAWPAMMVHWVFQYHLVYWVCKGPELCHWISQMALNICVYFPRLFGAWARLFIWPCFFPFPLHAHAVSLCSGGCTSGWAIASAWNCSSRSPAPTFSH
jgi:hypothetical protein